MQTGSYGPSVTRGRGQRGQLTQLPDGRWQARYRDAGRAGKRPQQTCDTKAEAAQWLRDRLEELDAARGGDRRALTLKREGDRSVGEIIDAYLGAHDVEQATLRKLRSQLGHARREFGHRRAAELEPYELQTWRKTLPAGVRHEAFAAFRRVLAQAVAWYWLPANPAADLKNPTQRRPEVVIPPWENLLAVNAEIVKPLEGLPIVMGGTGLRVEEWIALERRFVDLEARVIRVRYAYSQGRLIELGADGSKTWRQRRDVPLRQVVVDALRGMPTRMDSKLQFPADDGGHLELRDFHRVWEPAVKAAQVPYFPPKDCRHLYASEAIAAGYDLFTLSRRMGTSLKQIDQTYGHLVPDAATRELALLDSYDQARAAGVSPRG